MSDNNEFGNKVKLIKSNRPRFKKTKIWLIVVALLVGAGLLVNFFSGVIFPSGLGFGGLFSGQSVTRKAEKMYFVNMDKVFNYDEAQNLAVLTTTFGASSYIWDKGDEFLIVGNAYSAKSDAESVLLEISGSYPTAFLEEISFKKLNLNYSKYSKEQRTVIKNSLDLLDEIINNVYSYNIRLDKKEISPTTASSFVNGLKSESIIMSSRLDVLNSTVIYENTINIKNSYVKVTEILNELVLKLINSDDIHQPSKYSYINLIREKYDLYNKLG